EKLLYTGAMNSRTDSRHRAVGRPLPRIEGADKVAGKTRFTADFSPSASLWGKVLRSPLPHARILNIDVSKAKKLPGVRAVITAKDVSPRLVGKGLKDIPVLARERVLFIGDKIAAVAGGHKNVAEEALSLSDVDYEELPAVFDPLEAMQSSATILHPDYDSYEMAEE